MEIKAKEGDLEPIKKKKTLNLKRAFPTIFLLKLKKGSCLVFFSDGERVLFVNKMSFSTRKT